MMRTLLLAVLYIAAAHFAYVEYISPTFAYAHYIYLEPVQSSLLVTYALTWGVVLFHRDSPHPSQMVAALIYALCYVPIQLSLLFTVERDYLAILPVQTALAFSMAVLFVAARQGPLPSTTLGSRFASLDRGLGILTIAAIALIVATNAGHMRLVSFEDVYDLRTDSTAAPTNVLLGYLASWLSYCFISYFFARGLVDKKWAFVGLGILGSFVLYMAAGAKASLLLLPMTVGVVALWKHGPGFLSRTLLALLLLVLSVTVLLPDEGLGLWAKSILLVRVIGSSGWVAAKYFEYFDVNGYTFYTHIGPVNAIFGGYPYGEYGLGQLIGIERSGSELSNFNASFWASDGMAALGTAGVVVVTLPVALLLYAINCLTAVFHSRFTVAWITGFVVAMLNVPLATAMLSGGGGITLLMAWYATRLDKSQALQRPADFPGLSNIESRA